MKLNSRQREIVRLTADGFAQKQISDAMGISVQSINWEVHKIYRTEKFNCIALLVRWAIRNGLIEA